MKRMLIFCAAGLFLLASVLYAVADIARPRASPAPEKYLHTSLTIVPDIFAFEARLEISEKDLLRLNQAMATATENPSINERIVRSSPRTIMAGVFLFLSVSFAGVWLARSRQRRSHKAIAAMLLCATVIGAATIITNANAGPPAHSSWFELPQALNERRSTSGKMTIAIAPGDHGMRLIVPVGKDRKP